MSFPDPTPPPHSLTSPPMGGIDGGGFWPPFVIGADQQQLQNQQMDSIPQFDHHYQHLNHHNQNQIQNHNSPFKRLRLSDKPLNYPQMNPRTTNPPNLPIGGNRGTSHIFYKTRICAKFIEGTCRNGEHCTFAHGHEDLREPPPNWQDLIREKERGAGASPWIGDDQRIHRMKICKKYYNGEECPYGDKCNFLHERPSQPPIKKFKVDVPLGPGMGMMGPRDRESAAISIGTMGSGEQGSFWKTKVCAKWEMGQCPFGNRCHYAHGHSELKMPDEAEMGAIAASRKPVAFVQHNVAPLPPNMVVGGGGSGDGGEGEKKSVSKWKLTTKVNRIYADWLDDMSPPRGHSDVEEM